MIVPTSKSFRHAVPGVPIGLIRLNHIYVITHTLPCKNTKKLQKKKREEMGAYYDEIEIEDMVWDDEKRVYHYPCPCGDRFEISKRQLAECEDIATCPSCSLIIRVIYDPVRFFFVALWFVIRITDYSLVYSSTLRMNLRMMTLERKGRQKKRMTAMMMMRISKMLWRS